MHACVRVHAYVHMHVHVHAPVCKNIAFLWAQNVHLRGLAWCAVSTV